MEEKKSFKDILMKIWHSREASLIIVLIILSIIMSIATPAFTTRENLISFIKQCAIGCVASMGQTFIVAADGTIIVVGFEYGTYDASANAPGANAEDAQTAQIVFEEGHNTYDWLSGEYSNTEIAASTDAKASLRLDGIVHVKFAVSGEAFEGKDIVVYQDVFHKDVRITTHSDAQNANQTVKYPKIRTTAVDSLTGTHEGQALPLVGEEMGEILIVGEGLHRERKRTAWSGLKSRLTRLRWQEQRLSRLRNCLSRISKSRWLYMKISKMKTKVSIS